jgi:hydroxyisourate hydrolase
VRAGRLTTHVLDTSRGRPAAGVEIRLSRIAGDIRRVVRDVHTNADGRTDGPLIDGADLERGRYELAFSIGDYFRKSGGAEDADPFFDVVTIAITISDPQAHYHVPLLATPWSYATYRGS